MKPKHPTGKKRQDDRVTLWKDGVPKDYLVSRLVAMTWVLPDVSKLTVNHINGDWSDNRAENLEWVTREENVKLGFRDGLFDSIMIGIVLTDECGNRLQFKSMSEASRYLGRNTNYISTAIIKGQRVVHDSCGRNYLIEK